MVEFLSNNVLLVFIISVLAYLERNYRNVHCYSFDVDVCQGQGFMQDKIIASHTCFGGHMDVNC